MALLQGSKQANPKMSSSDEMVLKELEYATEHAFDLQLQTLQSILDRNATGARYLSPFFLGYDGPHINPDSFRRLVPISSYDDYEGPIQAMADGDHSPILSVDPLICFFYRCPYTILIFSQSSPLAGTALLIVNRHSVKLLYIIAKGF